MDDGNGKRLERLVDVLSRKRKTFRKYSDRGAVLSGVQSCSHPNCPARSSNTIESRALAFQSPFQSHAALRLVYRGIARLVDRGDRRKIAAGRCEGVKTIGLMVEPTLAVEHERLARRHAERGLAAVVRQLVTYGSRESSPDAPPRPENGPRSTTRADSGTNPPSRR